MSYRKPEVVTLSSSLKAIQGTKEECTHRDSPQNLPATTNAYLADE
jgi:hypothetical protein